MGNSISFPIIDWGRLRETEAGQRGALWITLLVDLAGLLGALVWPFLILTLAMETFGKDGARGESTAGGHDGPGTGTCALFFRILGRLGTSIR
jgi:hypothetical protein